MTRAQALLGSLAVCGLTAHAFVAELNTAGDPLRWHLDPLEPTVPPNDPAFGVHTNVVNPLTKAVRFFLASDAYSATNTAAELNAVRAAFGQWQSVAGTVLKFEDAGLVAPGVDVNTGDNRNVIFWAKNSTLVNGQRDNISGALGVTFNEFFSDNNAQAEADIVFNGVQYFWSADFNSTDTGKQFIESTAAHEIGHFIGLKHSPVGGATMLFHSGGGVNVQAGLSSDEIAAAKWLYGSPSTLNSLGRLRGTVTRNGTPVFGAVVVAEDLPSGNLIAGTVTGTNGTFDLPAMPPGQYNVCVTPLDPAGASAYLIRGRDISTLTNGVGGYLYDSVQTSFLPTTKAMIGLTGSNVSTNFSVTAGEPAFRITHIRVPTANPDSVATNSLPVSLRPGQSNYFVGVASTNLPTSGATLLVTGDGLTLGEPVFTTLLGVNFISVPISVASNATPGLRSFVVQRGNDLAYANGFLEIQSSVPDFNFDGLDDRFQRQYFPLFTAPVAGPNADPDGDGFSNADEYVSGTVPNDPLSLLKIESVTLTDNGSTITWKSAPQKRYQVSSRRDVAGDSWHIVSPVILGTNSLTEFTDTSATNEFRFYRVEALR